MKTFRILTLGFAIAAFAIVGACTTDSETEYDEAYYAGQASISCSASNFTSTETGGLVTFPAAGGETVISVDCGVDWTVSNKGSELLYTEADANTLTLTAIQNTMEEQRESTVTLATAQSGITFATITVTQSAYGAPEISVASTEWNAPAVGELTTAIEVTASEEWDVESVSESWISAYKNENKVSITVEENEDAESRTAEVVLSCTDGVNTVSTKVAVTQDARVYLTLSDDIVRFSSDGGDASITVDTNMDWGYSCDASWLSFEISGETLKITAAENTSEESVEASVTITAGDGAENVAVAVVSIIQDEYQSNAMILVFSPTSSKLTVQLPLSSGVNGTVDWGDGTTETVTSDNPSHTYASAGDYDVTFNGTALTFCNDNVTYAYGSLLSGIKQWGYTGLTSVYHAIENASITYLPKPKRTTFSNITSFEYAFSNCSSLETVSEDLFAGCENVTSFEGCFSEGGIQTVPAGLFKDCKNVTSFKYLFWMSELSSIPAGLFDNNTAVEDFASAFTECMSLTSIPAGLFDNCPLVTNFNTVFGEDSEITAIPEGLFDNNPLVTNFGNAFSDCAITSIPAGLFDNCPLVTTFNSTFYGCPLTSIPDGLFDNNPAVTTFATTFSDCSIKSIPDNLFKNTTAVTLFNGVFQNCTGLTSIPSGLFDSLTEITTCNSLFSGCSNLASVPEGLFANCKKVTNFSQTFNNCKKLTGESPYDKIEVDGSTVQVHLYERENYPDIYSKPSTTSKCFTNCSSLDDYSSIPSAWGGGGN